MTMDTSKVLRLPRLSTHCETRLNVTKCHACSAKRSNATCDGRGRLRTVGQRRANTPSTPRLPEWRETGTLATVRIRENTPPHVFFGQPQGVGGPPQCHLVFEDLPHLDPQKWNFAAGMEILPGAFILHLPSLRYCKLTTVGALDVKYQGFAPAPNQKIGNQEGWTFIAPSYSGNVRFSLCFPRCWCWKMIELTLLIALLAFGRHECLVIWGYLAPTVLPEIV